MTLKPALPRTLASHRPALLYTGAAVIWAGAIAAALEDVDGDDMMLMAVAALASAIIAFQHAMLIRHAAATETLTRTILSRPHDRDHEMTGPHAIVSALHERRGQRASQ